MAKMHYVRTQSGKIFQTHNPDFWNDCERLTQKAGKAAYQAQCLDELRGWIEPGRKIYCRVNSVSASGMSRDISVFLVQGQDDIWNISSTVAAAIDWPEGKQGIKAQGCGMDMGFAIVYALGAALWPDGTPTPHGTRNGQPDSSGGYALRREWL